MRTYCCTVLSAVVLLVWMASVAPAQRPASPSTEEATAAGVQLALSQGDLPGATARYRALFQATDQLHLPSLRKLCVEVLRRGLDSSSQDVQVQAGRGLKHAVDAETVPLLLDAVRQGKLTEEFVINEPLQPVRTEGLLPLLKESLNDNDRLVRIWSVRALVTVGGPEAVPPLCQALDDPFFWVRLEAVLALGQLGPELAPQEKLEPLLKDPYAPVVLDATAVLFVLGRQELEEAMREKVMGSDPNFAGHFTTAARVLGSPALGPILMDLLAHEVPPIRAGAADALGGLRYADASEPLTTLLEDPEVGVRTVAARALGELGDPRAAEHLVRLATNENAQAREAAVIALGKVGGDSALTAARAALNDEDPSVRTAAARALGHLEEGKALPLLQPVYRNSQQAPSVRAYAAVSAARLGDAEAVSQLVGDCRSQEQYVKVWATWGLGEVGGREQLLTLVDLLVDETELVRPVAAGALLKISNRLE